jgi:hypothetical protein
MQRVKKNAEALRGRTMHGFVRDVAVRFDVWGVVRKSKCFAIARDAQREYES